LIRKAKQFLPEFLPEIGARGKILSSVIKYYEEYFAKGGQYVMETWGASSRVATLKDFIQENAKDGDNILDVGCGDMYLSTLLPQYNWTGIDVNTFKAKGKAVKHELENTPYPFADASFDLVICSEVLEHIFDPMIVTKEIRRLIKPTGTYILSTPNHNFIDHHFRGFEQIVYNTTESWRKEHIHQYTIEAHNEMLTKGGFKIQKYVGADAHLSVFWCQGREIIKQYIESKGGSDPNYTETDQLIGRAFPTWNHTIVIVTRPV
jgi:2-polyprenyl-3-methyl-5-hydroxy-6-metoxy-1,4-benzoquinol methylase